MSIGNPHTSGLPEQAHVTSDTRFIYVLLVAGLLSSVASIASYSAGPYSWVLPGFLFGLFASGALVLTKAVNGIRRAAGLTAITTITYPLSILVSAGIQLLFWRNSSMDDRPDLSSITLFAGGFVGAFVVIAVTQWLVASKSRKRSTLVRSLWWSLSGGILGVVGWNLGSSLGMSLWTIAHDLHLTARDEGLLNALHGDTSHQFSLWLVWQTGIGMVSGLALQKSVD